MNDKQKGTVMGAFVADSLALGAHWVYNTDNIDSKAGRITDFIDPLAKNFHPKRSAGEFTHYGDQMLLFYNYLAGEGGFNPSGYMRRWTGFYKNYDGYIDHAMRQTNENISQGISPSGSDSTDLSGVMYVPMLAGFNSADLAADAEAAVRMTHNSKLTIQSAKFLASILSEVLDGEKPTEAIKRNVEADYLEPDVRDLINAGIDSIGKDTRSTIAGFGPSCPADHGLPGAVHLVGTYENDLETGLIENVMAGGDSAARGIFAGAVLGAYGGFGAIPGRWIDGLKADILPD